MFKTIGIDEAVEFIRNDLSGIHVDIISQIGTEWESKTRTVIEKVQRAGAQFEIIGRDHDYEMFQTEDAIEKIELSRELIEIHIITELKRITIKLSKKL